MGRPRPAIVWIAVTGLLLGVMTPATGQEGGNSPRDGGMRWSLLDAIGYGGLGFGLGLAAAWDMEGSGFGPPGAALALVGASTVAGTVAGAIIGRRAAAAFAEGRQIQGAHGVAVIGGVVLAGGTLGALASVPLINGEGEGTFLGSDERTVTVMTLAGAALGSLLVWKHREGFAFRRVGLAPSITGDAGIGLRVRVGF